MRKTNQRGFTLIDLVVIIVILGILAAFALPRFMGLERKARIASLSSVEGGLRSGAALAHSIWRATGTNPATIAVEGSTIAMANGYPTAAATGIQRVLAPGTVQAGAGRYTFSVVGGAGVFDLTGAPNAGGTLCRVTYTPPAAADLPPTLTQTVTGC